MKTSIINTLSVLFTLILFVPFAYDAPYANIEKNTIPSIDSMDKVITIVDVQGSRFSNRMWIFSMLVCANDYDNGLDAYKKLGTQTSPQLFAMESNRNFLINTILGISNSSLGFLEGEYNTYTLTFTHYNIESRYKELYLIDMLENKTIDIYESGTQYTFTAQQTNLSTKRFEIITSLPVPKQVDSNDTKNLNKKIKVFNLHNTIIIDNPSDDKGDLTLYDANSGRSVKKISFNAHGITTIPTDVPDGIYIAKGVTKNDIETNRIIVR